jgi:hypothetical protein
MPENEQDHAAPPIPEAIARERAAEETAERDDSLAATERRGRVPDADRDTSLPGTERRERADAERADAEEAREDPRPIPGEEHRRRE